MLRNELTDHRNWTFNCDLEDFKNPPLLQFFLTHLLFRRHVHKVSEMRMTSKQSSERFMSVSYSQQSHRPPSETMTKEGQCLTSNLTSTTVCRPSTCCPFTSA